MSALDPIIRAYGTYPDSALPAYEPGHADQIQAMRADDIVPSDPDARYLHLRALAYDATLWGLSAALQYGEMSALALDTNGPRYTGFATFEHGRELAGPGYAAFTAPNADTLYSNAWLDLRAGPVDVDIPDFGTRYYTLNLLDMYGNATNLSTRTVGGQGGQFRIVPLRSGSGASSTEPSDGRTVVTVTTCLLWILMRVFVRDDDDLSAAHALQDAVRLHPTRPARNPRDLPVVLDGGMREEYRPFFSALDAVLTHVAHPRQEDALVHRYRGLGLGGDAPWDAGDDDVRQRALRDGHADALAVAHAARADRGIPVGGGWHRAQPGAYGFNYLHRASTHLVGLGATVVDENQAFSSFADESGRPLRAGDHAYVLCLREPPVDAFWSLSTYDADTCTFVPNELGRYSINSASPALTRTADGTVRVRLQHVPPAGADHEIWLPTPPGRFFLVLRCYLPGEPIRSGTWVPDPIQATAAT